VKFAAKVIVQWQISQLLMMEHWNAFATFSKKERDRQNLKKKIRMEDWQGRKEINHRRRK
jgi:hypothetical protein